MPEGVQKKLEEQGWKIHDFYMEKPAGKLWIDIEFCMGDFCTGIYSEKGKWLLEPKKRCETFIEAIVHSLILQARVEQGEHWPGEGD